MKTKLLFVIILTFAIHWSSAQVGIGTTEPKSSLDIASSDTTNPSNTDGLLIPKIDNFPSTNPGIDQDGMMVYVTGNGTPTKGFYYWDNSSSSWVSVIGVKRINDLIDGRSDNDGSDDGSSIFLGLNTGTNDDQTNNNNVAVGVNSMNNNTSGFYNVALGARTLLFNSTGLYNTAIGTQSLLHNTANFNTGLGTYSLNDNTSGENNTGLGYSSINLIETGNRNTAIGSYSGFGVNGNSSDNVFIGFYSGYRLSAGSISGSIFIGNFAGADETSNNRLYIENSNADENNALIYGEFDTNVLRTNGQLQIGNPTATGYAFPSADGTANQIMTTDGSGQLNFLDASSIFTDTNTDNQNLTTATLTGTTLNLGIQNGTGTSIDLSSLTDDSDWVTVGANIERQSGNVYIGDTATTNNSLYLSGSIIDWDNAAYNMDLNATTNMARLELDAGIASSPSLSIGDNNTGFYSLSPGSIAHSGNGTLTFNILSDGEITFRGSNPSLYDFSSYNIYENAGVFMGTSNSNSPLLYAFIQNDANDDIAEFEVLSGNSNFSHTAVYAHSNLGGNETRLAYNTAGTSYALHAVSPSSYAGYFRGTVQLGNSTTNRYNMPPNDGTSGQVMTTDGAGNVTFQDIIGDGNTQNTLNDAYNEGGAGLGRGINAIDGAVEINGEDGFQVVGTYAVGDAISLSGAGARMFFNPRKAAFRAGRVTGSAWNNANVGVFSFASGEDNIASNMASTAFGRSNNVSGIASLASGTTNTVSGSDNVAIGQDNTVSGNRSGAFGYQNTVTGSDAFALGNGNNAPSLGETTIGLFATSFGGSPSTFSNSDRIFSVGIGTSPANRANALTIFKSGRMNINDSYDMPLSDGSSGQVLTTDGSGSTSWQSLPTNSLSLARITMSIDQALAVSGWQKINFDTVDFDTNNDFDIVTDTFVVPSTGYYRINASWRSNGDSTATGTFGIGIYVNSGVVRAQSFNHTGNGQIIRSVNNLLSLNAGDVVEIYINNGSTSFTISSIDIATSLEIEQVR